MFTITGYGKVYTFDSLEDAQAAAQRVFETTGAIVGIEAA